MLRSEDVLYAIVTGCLVGALVALVIVLFFNNVS
jgi:hypothetical protein